jgi:UDP-N-acetylglucosamine 2-epimerase (non-hydrolysing)
VPNREIHLLFVYGTRPEAIKLAPVLFECREQPAVRSIVCVTGQHRRLLDQSHEVLHVKPDIDLALLREGESLEDFCSRVIAALAPNVAREKPDVVIVQGDTTSALAASLVAFWARAPIAHVEAGLRTHDPRAPFPEEMHRRLIDQLARWHFAPTPLAQQNLLAEGVPADRIEVTGNTSIDALRFVRGRISPLDALVACGLHLAPRERLVVVTAHRRKTTGKVSQISVGVCGPLRIAMPTSVSVSLSTQILPSRGP